MTTQQVATLSGVSVRTLHHYDSIGLLVPTRNPENNYRQYTSADLDTLQQILFFQQCGFSLSDIAGMLAAPDFRRETAFLLQKNQLEKEIRQLKAMIHTIDRSLATLKGEDNMTDTEKFQALKEKMISDNRQQYGSELEKTYDSATLEKSEEVLRQMNTPTFQRQETLDATLRQLLQEENPDPSTLAALHKEWLQIMWGDAVPYSKEAHLSLAQTYVADERFAAHYGGVAAAQRLLTALENHL